MIFAALPAASGVLGNIRVPGSKSHTNRSLILAALGSGPVELRGVLDCDDADALIACLAAAGVSFEPRAGDALRVSPGPLPGEEIVFDVRDSGTAGRFLTAFAAASPGLGVTLTGSPRLCQRPIGPLVDALRRLGAEVEYAGQDGFPPLAIRGKALEGGEVSVDASLSSQFASALLLAAPRMRRGLRLRIEGNEVSRAYVSATLETMNRAGLAVRGDGTVVGVEPGRPQSAEMAIPGDFSSAVSLAGAVAVCGGDLALENLEWPSRQADAAAIEVLERRGAEITPIGDGLRIAGRARLGVIADASGFPDAVPVLCAVASGVAGESVFSGVGHLRLKESDRIDAIGDMLSAGGSESFEVGETIRVRGPRTLRAAPEFPTRNDHRIVMASALLCLKGGGLVENPRAVEKSYPGFFRDLFRCILP